MSNPLLLEGGAEFGGRMAEPDLRAIELAGGMDAPIRILPTAAAPDHNHVQAGENGRRWFKGLGATDVEVVYVIDRESAQDEVISALLLAARLIYLPGGFPRHLGETLLHSRAWEAVLSAHQKGAVIAGSSAGAMVLCEHFYDPYEGRLYPGLNLIPNTCVLPHHNTMGRRWHETVRDLLPGATLIGIDESTGMILEDEAWRVHGAGSVTLHRPEDGRAGDPAHIYHNSEAFNL